MPTKTKISSGSVLVIARKTAVRTPDFTPTTLMAVRARTGSRMESVRPAPTLAAGQTKPRARANPTERDATEETRASQVIHPTSKPANSPNASRV